MKNHKFPKEFVDQLESERKRLAPKQPEPDLTWLLPENDPKPRKPYPLSEKQVDALIYMYQCEKDWPQTPTINIAGASSIQFYERLEKRRLVTCLERWDEGRQHAARYQLTHMGRSVASGLSDLPF